MMNRKKRSDRNHVLYRVICQDTGDSYIGLTVAQGQAFVRSVKVRWQKHVSRAIREDKDWSMCQFIRDCLFGTNLKYLLNGGNHYEQLG